MVLWAEVPFSVKEMLLAYALIKNKIDAARDKDLADGKYLRKGRTAFHSYSVKRRFDPGAVHFQVGGTGLPSILAIAGTVYHPTR